MRLWVKPSPVVGEIMRAVQDAWYGNPNITRDEALQIAKNILVQKNIHEIKSIMDKVL
jgi:hypothetical protein